MRRFRLAVRGSQSLIRPVSPAFRRGGRSLLRLLATLFRHGLQTGLAADASIRAVGLLEKLGYVFWPFSDHANAPFSSFRAPALWVGSSASTRRAARSGARRVDAEE